MDAAKIVSDPNILFGKPVIAGTRISVELVLEEMGAGASVDDLLREYPHLRRETVQQFRNLTTEVFPPNTAFAFAVEADPDSGGRSIVCTATLPSGHPTRPLAYYDQFVVRWARLADPRAGGAFTLLVRSADQ